MPELSELGVPGYHQLDAPGEPGVRLAFERMDNERYLQT